MPSKKYQQGHIFVFPSKGGKGIQVFVMMKKTGFQDVWIGNKHFYYDEEVKYNNTEDINFTEAFDPDRRTTTKKGKIVVKKKRKTK